MLPQMNGTPYLNHIRQIKSIPGTPHQEPNTMILSVHHVQILVNREQEKEARNFYSKVLGLTIIPKPPALAKRGGFWLDVGGSQVHVGLEDPESIYPSRAHVAYQVKNLEEMRDRLTKEKIPCKDGIPIPGMKRFEIRDPFGNRVEFLQLNS